MCVYCPQLWAVDVCILSTTVDYWFVYISHNCGLLMCAFWPYFCGIMCILTAFVSSCSILIFTERFWQPQDNKKLRRNTCVWQTVLFWLKLLTATRVQDKVTLESKPKCWHTTTTLFILLRAGIDTAPLPNILVRTIDRFWEEQNMTFLSPAGWL